MTDRIKESFRIVPKKLPDFFAQPSPVSQWTNERYKLYRKHNAPLFITSQSLEDFEEENIKNGVNIDVDEAKDKLANYLNHKPKRSPAFDDYRTKLYLIGGCKEPRGKYFKRKRKRKIIMIDEAHRLLSA